ncbi:MAG: hypothetical protein K6E29_02365 [Cyanobacteria bacterium RUI128]|nr:hypothetical protein [Cyanobacteria bacterium RUI128]
MQDIKILDCTLRDGGYINNWCFKDNTNLIIENTLSEAGIDFVESGFLTDREHSEESSTLYGTTSALKNKIVMVNFGEYDLSKIDNRVEVRLAFKQNVLNRLEEALSVLSKKKVNFSLNPMHISLYEENELKQLFELSNKYNPTCVTAVDTMGIMTEADTERIFSEFDSHLDKEIGVGFHSHDNLGLSLKNSVMLLSMNIDRTIILDSSLFGIGRGGGMLSTNIIADYLNKNYNKKYNIEMLNNIATKHISQYLNYNKKPYFLTAKHKCHPNYGKYLSETKCPIQRFEQFLEQIPNEYKAYYNKEIIKEICTNDKKNFLSLKEV